VDTTTDNLVSLEALKVATECLRTLAHPHRLRMVQMLLESEHTVGALAHACGIQSHMASEHLRLMKDRGLLASRREGRCTYYRVVEPGLKSIMGCVEARFGDRGDRRASSSHSTQAAN